MGPGSFAAAGPGDASLQWGMLQEGSGVTLRAHLHKLTTNIPFLSPYTSPFLLYCAVSTNYGILETAVAVPSLWLGSQYLLKGFFSCFKEV